MGSVTREGLQALQRRRPTESVTVDGVGAFHFASLSGTDRYTFLTRDTEGRTDDGAPALIVRTLVDEDGKRLYANADEAEVAGWDANLLDQLGNAALKASGLDKLAGDDAKKNSTPES